MTETAMALNPSGNAEPQSPLTLEQESALEKALAAVKHDPGAVFEPAALDAIRAARQVPARYARIRHAVKQAANVPMAEFDRLTQPESTEDGSEMFPAVDPWPEPVDGAALLDDLETQYGRFVVAERETLRAAALWCAFTWCHDNATVSPLAHISAPEKRCGKTVLLSCLNQTVARPLPVSSISSAALFRAVEKWRPCLLVDEADSFMGDNEDLRGVINSGFNRESAYVIRCAGDDNEPTRFATFAPKVLCGIGNLPGTIMDRSIPLRLRRKKAGESAERLRHSDPTVWEQLRRRLARWSADNEPRVRLARPPDIEGLNDRAQDAWEPLQQVAAVAGGDWPTKARNAALALHGMEEDTPSIGAELLADIKTAFDERRADRLFSVDLLTTLLDDEEAPWGTWNRGKPMTARQLAKRLGEFQVRSGDVRIGATVRKGYRLEQFKDAFARYLPAAPSFTSATTLQPSNHAASSDFQSATEVDDVAEQKPLKASDGAGCSGVADKNPVTGEPEDWETF